MLAEHLRRSLKAAMPKEAWETLIEEYKKLPTDPEAAPADVCGTCTQEIEWLALMTNPEAGERQIWACPCLGKVVVLR